jgi:hypothetical protein
MRVLEIGRRRTGSTRLTIFGDGAMTAALFSGRTPISQRQWFKRSSPRRRKRERSEEKSCKKNRGGNHEATGNAARDFDRQFVATYDRDVEWQDGSAVDFSPAEASRSDLPMIRS